MPPRSRIGGTFLVKLYIGMRILFCRTPAEGERGSGMSSQTFAGATGCPTRAALSRIFRTWRYAGGKRDLRFDLLRGFAVIAMVTDHIGGDRSFLYLLTGGDRFFV